jgi:hypothetical protein
MGMLPRGPLSHTRDGPLLFVSSLESGWVGVVGCTESDVSVRLTPFKAGGGKPGGGGKGIAYMV